MSESAKLAERQKHPRHSTRCPGTLFSGDAEIACEVLNISVGGAKIRIAEAGETVASIPGESGHIGNEGIPGPGQAIEER